MKSCNKYFVVVIFLLSFIASVLSRLTTCDITEPNLCKIDGYVLCSDFPKIIMDSNFNANSVTSLKFTNSLVPITPYGICGQLNNLQLIDISDSEVTMFDPSTFAPCSELHVLNLSHNLLTNLHFPNDVIFHGADNLMQIDLSYNRIYKISPSVFKNFHHLTNLDVSHNEITVLTPSAFPRSLKVLNLNFNQIGTFSAIDLINIEQINLSNNQLVDVKLNPSIKSFEADNNFLKSASLFDTSNDNLISLSLKNNSYENFSVISNFSSLLHLDMSFNRIKSAESVVFQNLINLKTLILKSIGLKSVAIFSALRDLETLDISGNNLDWIDFHSISSLENLKHLKLNNNNLNRTAFEQLYLFSKLNSVDISENNWECEDLRYVIENFYRLNIKSDIDWANFDNSNQNELGIPCANSKSIELVDSKDRFSMNEIDELGNLAIKYLYVIVLIMLGGLILLLIILSVRHIVKLCLSKYKKYKLGKESNKKKYSIVNANELYP